MAPAARSRTASLPALRRIDRRACGQRPLRDRAAEQSRRGRRHAGAGAFGPGGGSVRGAVRASLPDLERGRTAGERTGARTVPGAGTRTGLARAASGKRQQSVEWAEVVQSREPAPGEHVYTVAAQTDAAGLLYVTVAVARAADGGLALAGDPAFVGPPDAAPAQPLAHGREVEEPELVTVVQPCLEQLPVGVRERAGGRPRSRRARLAAVGLSLSLVSVQRLDWALGGGAVLATVQAQRRSRGPLHARLRTERRAAAGPLGGLRGPDGPRCVDLERKEKSMTAASLVLERRRARVRVIAAAPVQASAEVTGAKPTSSVPAGGKPPKARAARWNLLPPRRETPGARWR